MTYINHNDIYIIMKKKSKRRKINNKFKFLIFIILVISILVFAIFSQDKKIDKCIVIDAGHGGVEEPGCIFDNIYEKDINLAISKFLELELNKYGAIVFLTRNGDYDLGSPNVTYRKKSDFDQRIKKINQSNADLYVSIHLNVLQNKKYFGPQVFYQKGNEKSKQVAEQLQNGLNDKLKGKREVKLIPSTTYMYSKLNVTGVLVECGILSNETEKEKLITESYQQEFASILANLIQQLNF